MEKDHMLRVPGPLWEALLNKPEVALGIKPSILAREYLTNGVLGVKPSLNKGAAKEKNNKKTSMVICNFLNQKGERTIIEHDKKELGNFKWAYDQAMVNRPQLAELIETCKIEPDQDWSEEQKMAARDVARYMADWRKGVVEARPKTVVKRSITEE